MKAQRSKVIAPLFL